MPEFLPGFSGFFSLPRALARGFYAPPSIRTLVRSGAQEYN
jgi:hypothetical protein